MRLLKWLMTRLAGPRAPAAVIGLALVLGLPSLLSSFFIDEYVQAIHWREGFGHFINECYVFARGDDAASRRAMLDDLGAWWAAPGFKVAFWRPLSAATHAIDLALWPGNAALMHLHTLLWFLALLLATSALYRRLLTPRVATLALALYAWDDARGQVLSWVAKRNALIAGLLGICALIAYDRWRRDGWRPGAWLAPVLLAAALLSADMGIATTGMLFAYAICLDQGSLARRLARLLPCLLVVVVWQVAYQAGGYGVHAPLFGYLHPLQQPLAFLVELVQGTPILALGQLSPIAADFWGAYPPAVKVGVFGLAVAVLVVVGRTLWPRIATQPEARFWLLGAGLSFVPTGASAPSDTNLVFIGFGAAALLAMAFVSIVDDLSVSRWPRFVVGTLSVFNLGLGPLMLPPKCLTTLGIAQLGNQIEASIPKDPEVARRTLVVVSTAFGEPLYYIRIRRDVEGVPYPEKTRILASASGDVVATRLDAVTLRVQKDTGFFTTAMQRMYLDPDRPLRKGGVVELSNMTATVTETTDDGRPRTVEFRFSAPLESPEWLWMRGEGMRLVGWTPPKVGETVVVPVSL